MTPLEQFLTAIIWIAYGAFAAFRTTESVNELGKYICYITAAPLVMFVKAIYGIFKDYEL